MAKAMFYHAGCSVFVAAGPHVAGALDTSRYEIGSVHICDTPARVAEAKASGVRSVPALVIDRTAAHIDHGTDLSALESR